MRGSAGKLIGCSFLSGQHDVADTVFMLSPYVVLAAILSYHFSLTLIPSSSPTPAVGDEVCIRRRVWRHPPPSTRGSLCNTGLICKKFKCESFRIGRDDLLGCCIIGCDSTTAEGRQQWADCFRSLSSTDQDPSVCSIVDFFPVFCDEDWVIT